MKLRYTKAERLRKSAAETVLSDPAATSADRMAAVRTLERLESAARRRQEDQPAQPPAETVDDLVSALEKAEKRPFQTIENKEPEKALTAVNAPGTTNAAAPVSEDPQIVPEASTAFCAFCSASGNWNTRWPIEDPNGVLLCPVCFAKMCSSTAMKSTAKAAHRSWLYEKGTDENTFDLSAAHGSSRTSDFARSVAIWETQAREDADRQEQELSERANLEAQLNRRRADWIQNGGKI